MAKELMELIYEDIKLDKGTKSNNKYLIKASLEKNIKKYGEYISREVKNNNELFIYLKTIGIDNIIFNISEDEYLELAYKIKLMGVFKIDKYEYLINKCKDNSMHVQLASINTLSILGNVESFVHGIINLKNSNNLIGDEILLQYLNDFNGSDNEMNRFIINNWIKVKSMGISLFVNHLIDKRNIDFIYFALKLLNNEKLKIEEKKACISYISLKKSNGTKNILKILTEDDSIEVKILANKLLSEYVEEDIILLLKNNIKDKDLLVRNEAAKSLYKVTKDKQELKSIINENDNDVGQIILSLVSEEMNLVEYLYNVG